MVDCLSVIGIVSTRVKISNYLCHQLFLPISLYFPASLQGSWKQHDYRDARKLCDGSNSCENSVNSLTFQRPTCVQETLCRKLSTGRTLNRLFITRIRNKTSSHKHTDTIYSAGRLCSVTLPWCSDASQTICRVVFLKINSVAESNTCNMQPSKPSCVKLVCNCRM